MANLIELAKKYAPLLDKKYGVESKSAILDVASPLIKETAQAKTVLVPKITLQGLADYDRASGYVDGDVTLEWESHTFTQDRGRSFQVDAMDNAESAGIAFGTVAGEFIRTKVAPEIDAYRFSSYASNAGTIEEETLTADNVVSAIDAGISKMDDAEVPENNRVLFVSVATYNLMKQSTVLSRRFDVQESNGTVNRKIEVFDGMPVVKVPSARFKTAYVFNDGTTDGQTAGGFTADTTAVAINFLIISKSAVVQIKKTALPRIFEPSENQSADAWKFDYRLYHDAWVLDNKVDGIYASIEESNS